MKRGSGLGDGAKGDCWAAAAIGRASAAKANAKATLGAASLGLRSRRLCASSGQDVVALGDRQHRRPDRPVVDFGSKRIELLIPIGCLPPRGEVAAADLRVHWIGGREH